MLEIYDQRTAALIIICASAFHIVGFVSSAGAAFVCSESSELVAAGIARCDFSPVPISPGGFDDNERLFFILANI